MGMNTMPDTIQCQKKDQTKFQAECYTLCVKEIPGIWKKWRLERQTKTTCMSGIADCNARRNFRMYFR